MSGVAQAPRPNVHVVPRMANALWRPSADMQEQVPVTPALVPPAPPIHVQGHAQDVWRKTAP